MQGAVNLDNVNTLVASYNTCMLDILDKHAPTQTRTITIRPYSPWFNDQLTEEKKKKRKLKARAGISELQVDHNLFCAQANSYYSLLDKAKAEYYNNHISEAGHDQKSLFKSLMYP